MSKEIYDLVMSDLKERKPWEDRQAMWYEMRHSGLRRKFKPWPGAADLHYPLADSIIEKHKPFYYQQFFATELLASFQSLKLQDVKYTSMAAQWFDYQVKQDSNLEVEALTIIDHMLMAGVGVVKPYWDTDYACLAYDAIDPVYLIVPWWTNRLKDADRVTQVHQYSEESYARLKQYNQDAELVKRITGIGNGSIRPLQQDQKYRREGITNTSNPKLIIVWESYYRDTDGWKIEFFSPLLPDEPLRPSMRMPYRHGRLPFIEFTTEIKDKGFYSPRGIPEIVAAFETSLCKMWNEKHDTMTLVNRPIYSIQGMIGSTQNLKLVPGQAVNGTITPVQQQGPTISWDQEMISTRSVAEYRVGMPDFGMGQQINTDQRRTATEVDKISSLMGQNIDLRARIFRKSLSELFKQSWELLLEFKSKDLQYFFDGELQDAPEDVFHSEYTITPNGSADNYNKQLQLQKATARFQMFNNDPNINQNELRKSVLEADDPRLVKRLLINPMETISDQAEKQASEINDMLIGFPVQIKQTDKHEVHLQTMMQFIQRRLQTGEPITPELAGLLLQHGGQHTDALHHTNAALAKQLMPQMKQVVGILTQIIQAAQQQAPQSVIQSVPPTQSQLAEAV